MSRRNHRSVPSGLEVPTTESWRRTCASAGLAPVRRPGDCDRGLGRATHHAVDVEDAEAGEGVGANRAGVGRTAEQSGAKLVGGPAAVLGESQGGRAGDQGEENEVPSPMA